MFEFKYIDKRTLSQLDVLDKSDNNCIDDCLLESVKRPMPFCFNLVCTALQAHFKFFLMFSFVISGQQNCLPSIDKILIEKGYAQLFPLYCYF